MAFGYKASITVDHTKVSGTGDLSNYPVLIKGTFDGSGTEPDLRSTANGGNVTSASGYDICFYSDENLSTKLSHEIISYAPTTGEIIVRIKFPTLHYASDDVIYMGYGDGEITTSQEDKAGVWSNGYVGVYHLKEASGGTGAIKDSTGNGYDLTDVNTPTFGQTGKIYKSIQFTHANGEYLQSDQETGYQITDKVTVEGWFNFTNEYTDCIYLKLSGTPGLRVLRFWNTGKMCTYVETSYYGISSEVQPEGSWIYLCGRYDNATDTITMDVNSNKYTKATETDSLSTNGYFTIAADYNNTGSFSIDGYVEAVRVSNVYRTDGWITTTYTMENDPSTFYAMGAETSNNAVPSTPTNSSPANAATNQSRTPTLTASAFSDTDSGDTHAASQWQVATDSGFSSVVWDSGEDDTNKTSIVVNATNGTFAGAQEGRTTLASNTTYYWHVKYKDSAGGWSSYS